MHVTDADVTFETALECLQLKHFYKSRFFFFFFFHLGFTALQDYFTHFEPIQSIGGAKTGDPREKIT